MRTFEVFMYEPGVLELDAGDQIFKAGDENNRLMYAVIEGEVEIRLGDRLLETVPSGGVFGEMALLYNGPRAADAVAKTDCRVAAVAEERFVELVSENPEFVLEMMRLLADRLLASQKG